MMRLHLVTLRDFVRMDRRRCPDGENAIVFVQDGRTPLYSAACNGHEGVVLLLLDSKAAVDTASNVSGMICVLGCFTLLGLGYMRGRLA
jgi:hypothetical protein